MKLRSTTTGNETARGDASAAPDNPGTSPIAKEEGHEVCAMSNDEKMMQVLALSSSHRSIDLGENQDSSTMSIAKEKGHEIGAMSYDRETMQALASSSSRRSIELGKSQDGSTSFKQPEYGRTRSNNAETMHMITSSTWHHYGNENVPTRLRTSPEGITMSYVSETA
jgi:hypothetical protein